MLSLDLNRRVCYKMGDHVAGTGHRPMSNPEITPQPQLKRRDIAAKVCGWVTADPGRARILSETAKFGDEPTDISGEKQLTPLLVEAPKPACSTRTLP